MYLVLAAAFSFAAQHTDTAECARTTPNAATRPAAEWLARARAAVGWTSTTRGVLQLHAVDGVVQSYQSDRTYPPFFYMYQSGDVWLDLASGVERQNNAKTVYPSAEYPAGVLLNTERVTVQVVFDATQGDVRAQADSAWIGRLFPVRHPIVVVVTDLAWPHVAGVRFWVASGATIVSHRASRSFLETVLARRWTAAPDRLERSRPRAQLHFRPVTDSLHLAGGAVVLYPIDGIASESALMGFVRGDRFLWASDYMQSLSEATQYGREVRTAARRVGIAPDRLAAEHLPLSDWATLERVLAAPDSLPRS